MEARLIRHEAIKLERELGPSTELFIMINTRNWSADKGPISCGIYPRGVGQDRALTIYASSWEEMFTEVRSEWAKHSEKARRNIIRKMALEIIRLTAEGNCTDSALRGNKFSSEEVAEYGAEACEDANQIASNGPFVIAMIKNANAA
jgi:hypothetical protein